MELGGSLILHLIMDPLLLFAITEQLHSNLPDVGGDQCSLCTLDGYFHLGEVEDQDVLEVLQEFPIHKGGSGSWHG